MVQKRTGGQGMNSMKNGSSCPRNRLSQQRDCPPVWRDLRTDAQPIDNDRAIADVQHDRRQQVLPVSASDGHAQELLHAERHRHQPDGEIIILRTAAR